MSQNPGLRGLSAPLSALWARFSLGTMWSMAPQVKDDHQLRTHGPYAVTRHPIYTGLLGMLLGATLLSGIGQWIVLLPAGLVLFAVKIRMEEHLMLAAFPEQYPRYRRQVPQLVPGLYVLRQHHSASSYRPAVVRTHPDRAGHVDCASPRLAKR